ncbi:hypothetical protein GOBAR_AA01943 [Gossypium barbadense]|uniref:non-specific serine/threonine protein kinase n=1 Tax=Gossypium barbadense TaxID=3634 RepID=A0A2P5YSU5_GOSBA|nr:hypothetical protein GOBAR_AA01943 [Gossypium barbadense]
MDLSKKHLEASSTSLLVCTEVIILLSSFNLLGHYFLGLATATTVIRGNDTDQRALLQFKSKITSDQIKSQASKSHQVGTATPQSLGIFVTLHWKFELSQGVESCDGEIPSNLSACSKLTFVRMRSNQLTGEIPGSFGLLSKLKFLSFINNSLTGSIPPALGNLSSLEELYFTYNALSGVLPEALGRLTNLTQFSADENVISGIIPTAMFNLSNIIAFSIRGNEIQGTLDPNLAITMPYVGALSVWGNRIYGEIPISISNASNLYQLQLDGNRLSGNVPSLEKLEKLFTLNLGENHLGYGREGDLNFICTLVNKTTLKYLDIGINNLGGVFPECISNFSSNLLQLVIQQNKIWGRIPEGIANLINLETLGASRNQLSGPIPSDIGRLQNLKIFYASNNSLSGYIPHSIGNLTVLSKLALDFNNLQGTIPSRLGNLKSLGEFHVSKNKLSGLLPSSLGSCISLEKLFLDGNLFEGPIPSSLSSLRGLEALDVSNNNLSGVIPSGGIFKNASATFVEGNRVTLAFTCLLILWFRKKKEKPTTTTSVENSFLQLSYQSILRATDGFSTQNLVGSGSFGSVYKGVLEASGAVIAVKVLNLLNCGASRSFLAECEARTFDIEILSSLEDWLHPVIGMNEPETARNLNFFQRVSMAIDVAYALEYLHHHCEEPIIHCDLKPSNILLDEEMVGHISDFGLAKILSTDRLNYSDNKSSSLGLRGTIGYAAPEYGMGNELSTKGDVYSFGILLLEMFTGKRPTDEGFKEGLSLHNFVKEALPERVTDIIDPILLQERIERETLNENSLGSDIDLRCWNSIFEIGLTCSSKSPHERIDMSDVVTKLCKIRDKLHPT